MRIVIGDASNLSRPGWKSFMPTTSPVTLPSLNHEAEIISGYSCEEARRMNLAQLVAPEFAADICEQIAHTVRDVPGSVYELDIITKDGRRVALEVSTEVIAHDGETVQIQGIAV